MHDSQITTSITIPAARIAVTSSLLVGKGDVLTVSASGRVHQNGLTSWGPDGLDLDGRPHPSRRLQSACIFKKHIPFSLVCWIGDTGAFEPSLESFVVGYGSTHTVQQSGVVYFACNDWPGRTSDANSGAFSASVQITRAGAPAYETEELRPLAMH
ncbi:MAG: hypothetical protein AAF467_02435 [Actinomycetota bacterium]